MRRGDLWDEFVILDEQMNELARDMWLGRPVSDDDVVDEGHAEEAGAQIVVDLERGELAVRVTPARRPAPHSREPTFWWEWQCPICDHLSEKEGSPCPQDGHLPRKTCVSMPFLWLG